MLIIHGINEVYTDLGFGDHCYAIGLSLPNHPVPATMETAKYYYTNWSWIITALARMRIKLHHELRRGESNGHT
jgi:hypothetical protein